MSRKLQITFVLAVGVAVGGLLYARGWLFNPLPSAVQPVAATSTNVLIVHYHERPPYYVFAAGRLTGLCGAPASQALEAAGIPFRWQRTPPQRQLHLIQSGQALNAGLGWYETPERQSYARFSAPLYCDQPTVALVRQDDARFGTGMTVDEFLSVSNAVLLVKESYSYGDWLDEHIRRLKPRQAVCTGDNVNMLHMVEARRADYFFLAGEEAVELLTMNPDWTGALRIIHFAEMPPGNSRHLMFARRVPEEWIERINQALLHIAPASLASPP